MALLFKYIPMSVTANNLCQAMPWDEQATGHYLNQTDKVYWRLNASADFLSYISYTDICLAYILIK